MSAERSAADVAQVPLHRSTTHGAIVVDVEEECKLKPLFREPLASEVEVFYADGDRRFMGRELRIHRSPECCVLRQRSARYLRRKPSEIAAIFPPMIYRDVWDSTRIGRDKFSHWCRRCPPPVAAPDVPTPRGSTGIT